MALRIATSKAFNLISDGLFGAFDSIFVIAMNYSITTQVVALIHDHEKKGWQLPFNYLRISRD